MVIFSYTFLAIALARPQFGSRLELVKRRGLDIMIALDISLSMQSEDVKPNRFRKAKHEIQALIDKLNGDRVALIIFAGDSFVQCPLTDDYDAAKMLLDALPQPEYLFQRKLIQPGTDIGRAIRFGIKVFQRREARDEVRNEDEYTEAFSEEILRSELKYKALILVTDGENLVPSSDPLEAAKEAAKEGIHIYTLGVGVPRQSTPIPLHDSEGKFMGYKRDGTGKIVLTQLNDTLLRKISALGGGRYYLASQRGAELNELYKDISSLERRELEKLKFTQHEERFQYFLLLALALLAGELILGDRYNGRNFRTRNLWLPICRKAKSKVREVNRPH